MQFHCVQFWFPSPWESDSDDSDTIIARCPLSLIVLDQGPFTHSQNSGSMDPAPTAYLSRGESRETSYPRVGFLPNNQSVAETFCYLQKPEIPHLHHCSFDYAPLIVAWFVHGSFWRQKSEMDAKISRQRSSSGRHSEPRHIPWNDVQSYHQARSDWRLLGETGRKAQNLMIICRLLV